VGLATSSEWVENRPSGGWRAVDLRELWGARELVLFFALRDLRSRYRQAVFGIAWAVLQPLAAAVVLTFVFRELANVRTADVPYPAFALLGFLVWSYFSSSAGAAMGSLVGNATLVTKVYFPRIAAPAGALLPGLVHLLPGFALLAAVMVAEGIVPGPALAVLPLCLVALVVVTFGVGLLLSALNVKYRDVGSVFGPLFQLWLFASPVAYPTSMVSAQWRWLYGLNPMVGVIEVFRWSVLGAQAPGAYAIGSAATALALLVGGLAYFRRTERQFADVI
jgi:ABC-type polysaccharide/polyol phosphate export permease